MCRKLRVSTLLCQLTSTMHSSKPTLGLCRVVLVVHNASALVIVQDELISGQEEAVERRQQVSDMVCASPAVQGYASRSP